MTNVLTSLFFKQEKGQLPIFRRAHISPRKIFLTFSVQNGLRISMKPCWGLVFLIQKRNVALLLNSEKTLFLIISFSYLKCYLNPQKQTKYLAIFTLCFCIHATQGTWIFFFSPQQDETVEERMETGKEPVLIQNLKYVKRAINWNLWFTLKAVFEENSHVNNSHYKLVSILLKNGISEKVVLPLSIKSTGKKSTKINTWQLLYFQTDNPKGMLGFWFCFKLSLVFNFQFWSS